MAKLIVDCGGTKMEFALIEDSGNVRQWEVPGMSVLAASEEELAAPFASVEWPELEAIHFYGAGVATDEVVQKLLNVMPESEYYAIDSDLVGAARALFGDEPGVAVILGTGSNSGQYDGREIVGHIPPLGYILGDEGSGASLGRALLKHVYRYDPMLRELFEAETGLTYAEVLNRTYRQPQANKFLASLVPFMANHIQEPAIAQIVTAEFRRLKEAALDIYPEALPIGFVGGVAAAFEPMLKHFYPEAVILGRPMPHLIKYHATHED